MKIPRPMVQSMMVMLRMSIPLTYIFMAIGAFGAIASLIKSEWNGFLFSLAFIGFAVFHRFYCIRMLDSIERTGTTYKWRLKID